MAQQFSAATTIEFTPKQCKDSKLKHLNNLVFSLEGLLLLEGKKAICEIYFLFDFSDIIVNVYHNE